VRYWLKLGYFTAAVGEGGAGYWKRRSWVSDGPGRRSSRWDSKTRPRRGQRFPAYGPQYAIGDRMIIYVKGRGCPAIMEVGAEPRWDPGLVDEEGAPGEGDRWGVVTEVLGLHAVALTGAPQLADIGVAPTSVMQKGHIELAEWQYRQAEELITGRPSDESVDRPEATLIPIERGEVDGYDVVTPAHVRRATRRESHLVNDYAAFLQAAGDVVKRTMLQRSSGGPLYSDIFNKTRNQLIEAKASGSRGEIRMAIGQLADYGRFVSADARKAVLLEAKPHPDLLDLLKSQDIAVIWRHLERFVDTSDGDFT
jgi:hypothetical protein